jgi:senataxin
MIFDLIDSQETGEAENGTLMNPTEANFVLELCKYLNEKHPAKSIGVIAPYQCQVLYIRELTQKSKLDRIDVGTVDGFQGREKDIILLSCVRAKNPKSDTIGFLSNRQRLNVSLTRAKYALYIICHKNSFKKDANWNECIQNAIERNFIQTCSYTQADLNNEPCIKQLFPAVIETNP